jgi:hypothetical protein
VFLADEANSVGTGGGTEASPKRGHELEAWRAWGYLDIGEKCVIITWEQTVYYYYML